MDTELGPGDAGEAVREPGPPESGFDCHEPLPALPERYESPAEIARGSFGLVLSVHDRVLRRAVAMKILHPSAAEHDEIHARFIRETEVIAELQHPGIVTIFDRGVLPDGRPWYSMEEVRGVTLAEAIDDVHHTSGSAQWTLRRLVDALARVAQAVGYAHQHHIVHRDLKPANIMLGAFGEVLVMDWGLARRMSPEARNPSLSDTIPLSPDMVRRAAQADVFAGGDAFAGVMATGAFDSVSEDGAMRVTRGGGLGGGVTRGGGLGGGVTRGDGLGGGVTRSDGPNDGVTRSDGSADGVPDDEGPSAAASGDLPMALTTRGVLGTPEYMSPEQARGDWDEHGPASDVFALGAMLYHLLAGRAPYGGQLSSVLRQAVEGRPRPLHELLEEPDADLQVLASICERAMRYTPEERYLDADAFGRAVLDWLDGVRRRGRAAQVLLSARALKQRAQVLRRQAQQQQEAAVHAAQRLMPHSPLHDKTACWRLEDNAEQTLREAAVFEARWLEKLHAALNLDPYCADARVALGQYYDEQLTLAERRRDTERIAHYETLLSSYAARGFIEAGSGQGMLTLHTRPSGAEVLVERYQRIDRKLVPVAAEPLGRTPLNGVLLPKGSYRLRLRAPGHEEVLYPVMIERGTHWDGVPPGDSACRPIVLPPLGSLAEDDIYVPAGWCQIGGDTMALDSLPSRRVWVDGFIIKKHPVTNAEYAFLIEELLRQGKTAEAQALRSSPGLGYDGDSGEAPEEDPRLPAVLVTWQGAQQFARFRAQQSDLPWRLAHGIEREKAARGADGRRCPWGDHVDPAFAVMAESHSGPPQRARVDDCGADISPYGVTGLAGNVRDWCHNDWAERGPTLPDGRLLLTPETERGEYRVVRGGAWMSTKLLCLAATRFALRPDLRRASTGFRLVRSYPAPSK